MSDEHSLLHDPLHPLLDLPVNFKLDLELHEVGLLLDKALEQTLGISRTSLVRLESLPCLLPTFHTADELLPPLRPFAGEISRETNRTPPTAGRNLF